MTEPDALQAAEATEAALRAQLGELVSAKVRAEKEGARLADRATVPGAAPELAGLADRYRAQAARLASEVEDVRGSLRAQEARTEQLRAGAAGA
jgi:chromosome segregation ATPase